MMKHHCNGRVVRGKNKKTMKNAIWWLVTVFLAVALVAVNAECRRLEQKLQANDAKWMARLDGINYEPLLLRDSNTMLSQQNSNLTAQVASLKREAAVAYIESAQLHMQLAAYHDIIEGQPHTPRFEYATNGVTWFIEANHKGYTVGFDKRF